MLSHRFFTFRKTTDFFRVPSSLSQLKPFPIDDKVKEDNYAVSDKNLKHIKFAHNENNNQRSQYCDYLGHKHYYACCVPKW